MSEIAPPARASAYRCPGCGADLRDAASVLVCVDCQRQYPVKRGIPIFAGGDQYWGHLTAEEMQAMTRDAEAEGWRAAMRRYLPEPVWTHIDEPARADGLFLLPLSLNTVVLDAGCMWGGLSVPLARQFSRVHALDATFAGLDFLAVRARQEGLSNLDLACGTLLALPYRERYFDAVFVNGVLEWVGSGDHFVLERDYGRRRAKTVRETTDVEALQGQALREVWRVLKPGGWLYLAIENRYAYKYFVGAPDDHVGLRFTSLMPRRVADFYTRWRLNQSYRAYTYSASGLRRLLRRAGLEALSFYACFDSYHQPQAVIPLQEAGMIGFYLRSFRLPNVSWWKRWAFGLVLASGFAASVVPSFVVLARRPSGDSAREA